MNQVLTKFRLPRGSLGDSQLDKLHAYIYIYFNFHLRRYRLHRLRRVLNITVLYFEGNLVSSSKYLSKYKKVGVLPIRIVFSLTLKFGSTDVFIFRIVSLYSAYAAQYVFFKYLFTVVYIYIYIAKLTNLS